MSPGNFRVLKLRSRTVRVRSTESQRSAFRRQSQHSVWLDTVIVPHYGVYVWSHRSAVVTGVFIEMSAD
jgi:hypothetical protein